MVGTRPQSRPSPIYAAFALAESPLAAGQLWAGTDDGRIHLTRDGGRSWTEITPPDLPRWATVRMIDASTREAGTAYVAAEAHKLDDTLKVGVRDAA